MIKLEFFPDEKVMYNNITKNNNKKQQQQHKNREEKEQLKMRNGNNWWDLREAKWAIRQTVKIRGGDHPLRTFCCRYHEDGRKLTCRLLDCSRELP